MVWTHDRTTSLPLLMLMHALVSYVAIVLAPEGLTNTGLLTSILVSAVAMWLLVAAVGFMRLTGPRRGNQVLRANVGGEGFR
jgi:hypothetical protein